MSTNSSIRETIIKKGKKMREKETFTINRAALQDFFGNKTLLSPSDISKYSGLDIRTVKKYYFKNLKAPFISIDSFAQLLSV